MIPFRFTEMTIFMAMLMAFLPSVTECQFFVGNQQDNSLRMVTSRGMYLSDWMPFPESMMEMATLHGLISWAPYWYSEMTLTNRSGHAMSGYIAFETMRIDADHSQSLSQWDWDSKELESRVCNFDDERLIETNYQSITIDNIFLQFKPWRFDSIPSVIDGTDDPAKLHFDATQLIRPDFNNNWDANGQWMNVIHLCVTEGHHHRHHLDLEGHQIAFNPMGHLGGQWLMALPILMILLISYLIAGALWAALMICHRQNIMKWIHYPLTIGIIIGFVETALEFHHFYAVNVHGFDHLSQSRHFLGMAMKAIVSIYTMMMMVILCSGVGIARPGLGRKTKVFLAVFAILFSAAFVRAEYLETILFHHGFVGSSQIFELLNLLEFIVALQIVLIIVCAFNIHNVMDKLQREGQHHKMGLYNGLAVVAVFCSIVIIKLERCGNSDLIEEYYYDSSKWVFYYLLNGGLSRILQFLAGIAVLFIYRPHSESLQLALSNQVEMEQSDEEASYTEWSDRWSDHFTEGTPKYPYLEPLPSWIKEKTKVAGDFQGNIADEERGV